MADDSAPMVEKSEGPPAKKGSKEESEPFQQNAGGLQRSIGLLGCAALLVGTIIGSGIFASPRSVSNYAQSPGASLVIWAGCGILAMLASLSYCELGTMFPNASGGEYHYLKEAFGDIPAFLYAYVQVLVVRPSQLAIIALTCGNYIIVAAQLDENTQMYSKIIAACVIAIILTVNCLSVKWATVLQVFFTAAKLIAVIMIIVTGIVRLVQGHTDQMTDAFNGTSSSISDIGYAFYGGLWAYDGWNNLNYVTEELKNPIRDLPLAIMSGIPFVTMCYVLVNIAYFTVLSSGAMAKDSAVAVTLANRLYGVMWWCIPVLVACSTFGAANGSAFTSGRIVFVAARGGHMPRLLAMIHRERRTPLPALMFTCFVAWMMLIPESSNFISLVNYFNFAAWTFYGATMAALLWLRIRQPERKRPYKVFILLPIIVFLCAIYLVVAPFYDYPMQSTYCLLFILSGLIFYAAFIKWQIFPRCCLSCFDALTYKIQVMVDLKMPNEEEEGEEVEMNPPEM